MNTNSASELFLSSTAYWMAAIRAHESEREDRLFSDPYAAALAGEKGAAWMATRTAESVLPVAIRTRYFDDFLQKIATNYGVRQVVLLASGLDTRAYRLIWPAGTVIYELAQPALLAYKEAVLQDTGAIPAGARQAIGVDLTSSWMPLLIANGFDPQSRSLWLLEGFLFYQPNETIIRLLETITGGVAPGSWLGFDVINGAMLTSPITRNWVEMQAQSGAPWIGTMDYPVTFLAGLGWEGTLTQAGAPDAHYGRWTFPVTRPSMPDFPHHWFVTARYNPSQDFNFAAIRRVKTHDKFSQS